MRHLYTPFCWCFSRQRRLVSVIVAPALIMVTVLAKADDSADRQQELQQINSQIETVRQRLNANRKLLKNQQDKLSDIEQQIQTLRRAQQTSQQRIAEQQTRQTQLAEQEQTALDEQRTNIDQLKALMVHQYKQGSPNVLTLMLNQRNPHAVGRLQNYYRYVQTAQQKKLVAIKQQLQRITDLRQRQAEVQISLRIEQDKLAQQQTRLEQAQQQRRTQIQRLDDEVATSSKQLVQLQADRRRLNTLIAQIAARAAELARLEAERRAEEQRRANQRAPKSRPSRTPVAGGFKKQRGRLSPPVVADLKYRYGHRLAASGMRAQGHFYTTQAEQAVSSIFDGRVIFADYLKGYGLLMIVDHGDEHISLYGHNAVLYKNVGDSVTTGERIAASGTSGGLKQPGLYFEIRHNTAPVDPGRWLN